LPADGDLQSWKAFFFRIQAALEKYLVDFHGLDDMGRWTAEVGEVFATIESADPGTVSGPALRLARIAQCYGSSYEIGSLGPSQASLEISSCAIWRYREQAREAGVQLTLDRPCTFCTEAVVEIARANGVVASFDLFKKGDNHGCAWSFARPGDQAYGVNGPTAQVPKCAGKAKVASTADPAGSGQNLASRSAYFTVLALCWPLYGMLFLVGTETFVVSPFIPAMANELGKSTAQLASLVAAYALSYALSAPFLGSASDRIGRGPLLTSGIILFALGNLLVSLGSTLVALLAGRALTGFGGAMAGPTIWALLSERVPALRGRAIGLGMGAFSLGQVIGVPVGGLIAGLATWRWEFAVLGACALPLLAVIFYSVLRHTQKVGTKQFAGPGLPLLSVWKNGPISLTFFMTFLFNAASLASYTFLGATLANTFSLSTAQLGMLGVLVGGGSLVGSLAGGALNDRQNAGHAFGAGVGSSCAIALGVAVLVVMTSHTLVTSLVA
jgi:DHA1 family inner membrane transport protein